MIGCERFKHPYLSSVRRETTERRQPLNGGGLHFFGMTGLTNGWLCRRAWNCRKTKSKAEGLDVSHPPDLDIRDKRKERSPTALFKDIRPVATRRHRS